MTPQYGDSVPEIKVDTFIRLMWVKNYQHGATLKVTKVNRKSFKATEQERSYAPGSLWTVHNNSHFGIMIFEGDEHIRTDWYEDGEYKFSGDVRKRIGTW